MVTKAADDSRVSTHLFLLIIELLAFPGQWQMQKNINFNNGSMTPGKVVIQMERSQTFCKGNIRFE